jgi:hypothetical protein
MPYMDAGEMSTWLRDVAQKMNEIADRLDTGHTIEKE